MRTDPANPARAFATLERQLVRRYVGAIEGVLRLEFVLLAALVGAFVFWQTRVPLDGEVRAHGLRGGAAFLGLRLAIVTLAGALTAGGRHAWTLAGHVPGPEWLALPLPASRIHRHLVWFATTHAVWALVPAFAMLLAGVRLLPAWWLLLGAAACVWLLIESARLACAVAARLARARVAVRGRDPLVELLTRAPRRGRERRTPPARWTSAPAWLALMRKDFVVSTRPGRARTRLLVALAAAALTPLVWLAPLPPRVVHFLALGEALVVAGIFGEWLLALAAADPFLVARALPLRPSTAWSARAAWAALASVLLTLALAPSFAVLHAPAVAVLATWTLVATFAIGLLAVNYGLTLHPRIEDAERLYALSLGLAVAASLMIPLLGWIVLLTAVIHSLRRVPRWAHPEVA